VTRGPPLNQLFTDFTDSVYHAYNHSILIIDQPLHRGLPLGNELTGTGYCQPRTIVSQSIFPPRDGTLLASIIRSLSTYHERLFSSALSCLNHQTEALCSRFPLRYDRLDSHDSLLCHSALLRYCRFPRHRCLPRHVRMFRSIS
jgi:hypothetical protein